MSRENIEGGEETLTSESFKKSNANSLIKELRSGFLIVKADVNYPNDPSLYEIIDLNSSVKDLMGKKNEDMIGRKITEIILLKKADLAILANVMNTGLSQQFEYYVKRLDEWLLISVHHSRNNFLTIIFENITDKKITEQKLIDSEQTMSLTLEVTGEGLWEWRADGTVIHNKQWCRILGLDENFMAHHVDSYVDRIHPDDREVVMARIHKAIEMQGILHHEYRMVRPDGTIVWVEDRGVAVVGQDGKFERIIGSISDITDYRMTQINLNQEKELLKSTLLSVGDGIIATDVHGNITIMNPVAEDLTGWKDTEAIGKNIAEVFQMVDPETDQSIICFNTTDSEENRHKEIRNKEASARSRNGKKYIINSSISPIRLSNDKLTGFVIIFRDITEAVEYQKEIEYLSYHDDLTGLYNRRYLMEALKSLDTEENYPFSIVAIDINNLKQTNDHYGHEMGDRLILETANILSSFFSSKGTVARAGGDEFTILLPQTSNEKMVELKDRMFQEIKDQFVDDIPISVAFGYAIKVKATESIEEILRIADNNMYENKRTYKQIME